MAKRKNAVRKDGRVSAQVYLGRVDGKRKYKTVYGQTDKEAKEKALQIKLAMRKGIDITAELDTFGDWADKWLKTKTLNVSSGRLVTYECNLKHLKARFEHSLIIKIRTADIQDLLDSLAIVNPNTKKPAAKKTLNGIKSTAAQIFQLAIDNRVMDYNPANAVKIPVTAQETPRRALSASEQEWITDTVHGARRAAMIMMYSGLRRGELIPLTWNDIDLKERTISVNKSVEFIKGKPVVKNSAKTKASIRVIDIPQKLVNFLSSETRSSILVCVNKQNKMHTGSSWKRMWESYLADLNVKYGDFSFLEKAPKSKFDPIGVPFVIPKITPHWLRHTFATMLYFAGVDILTAKDQLGHKDIKTTLEIYTHLDAIYKRKAMNKLDEYLCDASQMQVK